MTIAIQSIEEIREQKSHEVKALRETYKSKIKAVKKDFKFKIATYNNRKEEDKAIIKDLKEQLKDIVEELEQEEEINVKNLKNEFDKRISEKKIQEKEQAKKTRKKDTEIKAKYFVYLLYPDSIPVDFKERLKLLDYEMVLSPLHDKDPRESDDEITNKTEFKKAHYHLLVASEHSVFGSYIRDMIVEMFTQEIDGSKAIRPDGLPVGKDCVPIRFEVVKNVRHKYKYLTHDTEDAQKKGKYLYNDEDLIHYNHFDIARHEAISLAQKEDIKKAVVNFIFVSGIMNAVELKIVMSQMPELAQEMGIDNDDVIMEVIENNLGFFKWIMDSNYQAEQREEPPTAILGRVTKKYNERLQYLQKKKNNKDE